MQQPFSDIQPSNALNGPAGVSLGTKVFYYNPEIWPYLSEPVKKLIIAHERGHLAKGDSEFEADKYAFWKMIGVGSESLDIVKTFYEALPFSTPEQINRSEAMIINALEYESSKNDKIKNFTGFIKSTTEIEDPHLWIGAAVSGVTMIVDWAVDSSKAKKAEEAAEEAAEEQIKLQEKQADLLEQKAARESRDAFILAQQIEENNRIAQAEIDKKNNNLIMASIIITVFVAAVIFFKKK